MAVARAESLTAAAPVLKMDPATISRRIGRLEEAFGAALFAKSPQGYQLTDLGTRVWEEAIEADRVKTDKEIESMVADFQEKATNFRTQFDQKLSAIGVI